jgi:hypothetical protein
VLDSVTEFGINDAKPIAGKAKLIAGLEGECCWWCCLGDELDDVGDEVDEYDVVVSVDPLSIWDGGVDRTLVAANRAAAAAKGLIGGITELIADCAGEGGT